MKILEFTARGQEWAIYHVDSPDNVFRNLQFVMRNAAGEDVLTGQAITAQALRFLGENNFDAPAESFVKRIVAYFHETDENNNGTVEPDEELWQIVRQHLKDLLKQADLPE